MAIADRQPGRRRQRLERQRPRRLVQRIDYPQPDLD
jgi:hypothetical protein